MPETFQYFTCGDNGIVIEAGNNISIETHNKIRGLLNVIEARKEFFQEIEELIPTYTTLLIIYSPLKSSYKQLLSKIISLEEYMINAKLPPADIVHIPVFYGGELGPDLSYVAKHNNLSLEEVIAIHTAGEYLIYMLGFTPGFPYLGGMSVNISTPRLEVPRERISGGSVGIAGNQTGIYPIDSPGGWQIIGKTPLKLFDPNRQEAVLLKAGQYIKFEAIDLEEYLNIKASVEENSYVLKVSSRKER